MTAEQKTRYDVYNETRRLFLAGEIDSAQALSALLVGGWSAEEAGIAVSSWRTLSTLPGLRERLAAARALKVSGY
jgi:hypothetical protein